ncbi:MULTISPECIES: hypothetical protein [Luteimonas]|uniref:hypothetical protein n=1 Tax=Luteimonas TaxID=83614 RepID=UPI00117D2A6D|nr:MULTISPECIES: hypothetical protein [Luteimonas]
MDDEFYPERDIQYAAQAEIDFSVITMRLRSLPIFRDDLWLGMQAMNVGIADAIITPMEYALAKELFDTERTPGGSAMAVSALSQMWIFGLYEALRLWRERRKGLKVPFENGRIDLELADLPNDDDLNLSLDFQRRMLERYRDDAVFRDEIEDAWATLEPIFMMVVLFRMNLAKHSAPGRKRSFPSAPGYGRINRWCGALDYELLDQDGHYSTMNRRDIADALRSTLADT